MDQLSSDFVINIIGYLSVQDSGRLAATTKRYYYLVHHYRRLRGPELVASTTKVPGVRTRARSNEELVRDAVSQIQATPNLVLAFTTFSSTLTETLPRLMPPDAVILGAMSSSIQSNVRGHVEHQSNAAIMLGSLTNARVKPFCFTRDLSAETFQSFYDELEEDRGDWKFFMIYACGEGSGQAETFVRDLQSLYPESTIVGGICSEGYVSVPVDKSMEKEDLFQMTNFDLLQLNKYLGGQKPDFVEKRDLVDCVFNTLQTRTYQLEITDDGGIFGIALGGDDVPVRAIVSRGVKSLTFGDPHPSTSLHVDQVELHRPGDESYMFRGDDPPPYHLIRSVVDRDTDKRYSAVDLIRSFGHPDFLGIRRPNEDGFELHMPHPISSNINAFLILGNEDEFTGANIDLFELDGQACMSDMDASVAKLREQTQGKQILGAVMISCNGRGPSAGSLIPEAMADATRFAKVFPDVSLLGFYAGGEIGPSALAGRQSAFQTGKATLQGFTAVFAVFIVPIVDLKNMNLDDSPEYVDQFVQSRLGGSKPGPLSIG